MKFSHRKSLETHKLVALLRKHGMYYLGAGVLLLALFLFRKPFVAILTLFAMLLIGSFSTFYKTFGDFPIGFELITLFSVVIAYTYSPFVAVVSCILMTFFSHILTGRICVTMFVRMGVFLLMVIVALLLKGFLDIATTGRIISIVMNIIYLFLWLVVFGFNPITAVPSTVLNAIINFFLFSTVGVWLANTLG